MTNPIWKAVGYAVESPDGHVGVVEETVRIPGLERPAALAVRLVEDGRRVTLVPVTDVVDVDTARQTVRLRRRPGERDG